MGERVWQTAGVQVQPVDVVGMGVRTPFGAGTDVLFDGLCRGERMFIRHDAFVRAGLKHPLAAPLPSGCLEDSNAGCSLDRGTRLLEAVVRDALQDATRRPDLSATGVAPARVGLFVGTSSAGLGALTRTLAGGCGEESEARYFAGTRWVRRALGVEGPTEVICTVCASGAQAIEEACGWLQWGAVDLAIAAGYDPLEPFVGAGFDALGATADRAMPFRARRSGLVLGEAGAALILVRHGFGDFRCAGRILGWASASDAFHVTSPHPDGRGVVLALRTVLERANIRTTDVRAINAHGTSTVHNDRMEARALAQVFGPRAGNVPVYTVKGTIGHTLGAAGAVEAVVSFVSAARQALPPTCTDSELDPECDLDLVVEPRTWTPGVTLSISAGFGGVNCVLALGKGEP